MFKFIKNILSKFKKKSVETVSDVASKAADSAKVVADAGAKVVDKSVEIVEDTAKAVADVSSKAVDTAIDSAKVVADAGAKVVDKSVEILEDTAKAVADVTSKAVDTTIDSAKVVADVTSKAVDVVGEGIENLAQSFINTTKFLTDSKYRNEVGYPWIKSVIRENWGKVKQELNESEEMLFILWKYSQGKSVTEEEKNVAKEQLFDIIRVVPALAIFTLPGGAILLPLLAKALPWDLMPSAFREKVKEEYGEQALSNELKPDEEIPIDKDIKDIPDDLKKLAKEQQNIFQESKSKEILEEDNKSTSNLEKTNNENKKDDNNKKDN